MGNPFGKAFDAHRQRTILLDSLHALETAATGGTIIDLPYEWHQEFGMNLGSGYKKAE
jgi:hypothetical protein